MNRRTQLIASLILPALHFLWCLAIQIGAVQPQGNWVFVFMVDFPASIVSLFLGSALNIEPFLVFGLIGTAWWYFLSRLLVYAASTARAAASHDRVRGRAAEQGDEADER
jgi:hypothetical protein